MGKKDLREQFDFATDPRVAWQEQEPEGKSANGRSGKYRRETVLETSQSQSMALTSRSMLFNSVGLKWHTDALAALSYRFVHVIEDALGIPTQTFDTRHLLHGWRNDESQKDRTFLPPQHRIKLLKYPVGGSEKGDQGVRPHKDSSGWLTFLYQVGRGLVQQQRDVDSRAAGPGNICCSNVFEAAMDGGIRATVRRVLAPSAKERCSIPLTVSEVKGFMPEGVRAMRRESEGEEAARKTVVSTFLDTR